jgi:hypothetical protein
MVVWPTEAPPTGLTRHSATPGADADAVTTHVVALPSPPAGRVLALMWTTAATHSPTLPEGWVLVASRNDGGANRIYVLETDGTEGASMNVTTAQVVRAAWVVYEIGGVDLAAETWHAGRWDGNLTGTYLATPWGDAADTAVISCARSGTRTDNAFTKPARYESQVDAVTAPSETEGHCRISAAHYVGGIETDRAGEWGSTGTLANACCGILHLRGIA